MVYSLSVEFLVEIAIGVAVAVAVSVVYAAIFQLRTAIVSLAKILSRVFL